MGKKRDEIDHAAITAAVAAANDAHDPGDDAASYHPNPERQAGEGDPLAGGPASQAAMDAHQAEHDRKMEGRLSTMSSNTQLPEGVPDLLGDDGNLSLTQQALGQLQQQLGELNRQQAANRASDDESSGKFGMSYGDAREHLIEGMTALRDEHPDHMEKINAMVAQAQPNRAQRRKNAAATKKRAPRKRPARKRK